MRFSRAFKSWFGSLAVISAALILLYQNASPLPQLRGDGSNFQLACGIDLAHREIIRQQFAANYNGPDGLFSALANKANYPVQLYYTVSDTMNLLHMAAYCDDKVLLDELSVLYFLPFSTSANPYVDAMGHVTAVNALQNDPNGNLIWPDQNKSDKSTIYGWEIVLDSTDFVAATAYLYGYLVQIPQSLRTSHMNQFVSAARPYLMTTLNRWIYGAPAPGTSKTQPTMWTWPQCMCASVEKADPSGTRAYTFTQYVEDKRAKSIGAKCSPKLNPAAPPYCNADWDFEMFVAMAAAEFLGAEGVQAEFAPVSSAITSDYTTFIRQTLGLFEDRFKIPPVTLSGCSTSFNYALFDPGMKMGSDVDYTPENWNTTCHQTAWDVSHTRHIAMFLDSMYRHPSISQPTVAASTIMSNFANLIATRVYNGSTTLPLFTNYIDGTNIAYRGVGPYGYSAAYLDSGVSSWATYNSTLQNVNKILLNIFDNQTQSQLPTADYTLLPSAMNSFQEMNFRASLATAPTARPSHSVPFDFIGGGRADIYVHDSNTNSPNYGQTTLMISKNGNQGLSFSSVTNPVTPGFGSSWVVRGIADFNGDGFTDVLVHDEDPADATYGQTELQLSRSNGGYVPVMSPSSPTFTKDWVVRGIADFNGDGIADVLVHNENTSSAEYGQTMIFYMKVGGFSKATSTPKFNNDWVVRGIADFNGDGVTDIFIHNENPKSSQNGQSMLFLLNRNGSYETLNATSSPATPGFGNSWAVRGVADFTGTGRAGILLHDENSADSQYAHTALLIFDQNGAYTELNGTTTPATPSFAANWIVRAVGDFNGDGIADILIHDEGTDSPTNGQTEVLLMNSGVGPSFVTSNNLAPKFGYTALSSPVSPGFGSDWIVRGVADFNGDGVTDILLHDENPNSPQYGQSEILLFNTTGNFTAVSFPTAPGFSNEWTTYDINISW